MNTTAANQGREGRAESGRWHARMFFAPLLAAALLGLTYLYWHNEERAEAQQRRQAFHAAAERAVSNLADRMAAYEIVLRGVKGYFDGSERIGREEFRAYIDALQLPQTRPGLQGIALLERVHRAPGAEHAPVTHIEPLAGDNLRMLGLDATTQPALRDALDHARDTGTLVLSGPLERATDGSAALAMAMPLYRKGSAPQALEARRADLQGWVAALFRMDNVIQGLTGEFDADLALAVHDGPSLAGSTLVFASHGGEPPAPVEALEAVHSLDVGGRRWTVALRPLPSFGQRFGSDGHHVIALLGALLSLLAGWFIALQATGHQRAAALARDMTRELRGARDDLENTLNAVPDLLLELGLDGRIHHYRSARADLLAVAPESLVGRTLHELLPAPAVEECLAALAEAHAAGYSAGRQYGLEVRGEPRWFELSVARKEGGEAQAAPPRFIALSRDVTSRHEAEAAMHRLAYFDGLTGLPNRRLLLDHLRTALEAARLGGFCGGLFYIDLDNFKQINDARGHPVGDSLLVQAARRLDRRKAPGETVARLGGDEFVVLVPRLGSGLEAARQAGLALAAQLHECLDAPYTVEDALYGSTGSIGATLFPRHEESAEDLLREADTAMYRAKELGRNRVCFFEPGMLADAQERLALEQDLKQAVAEDALQVYVQPQVDAGGRLLGGELLLRWHHPRRGHVPPARFIPVAEESGLILPMGARVIRKACEALAMLHAAGRALSISVNVSQRQFRQEDFVARVREALEETGAPPSLLILEVTESLLVENWEDAVQRMAELVRLGVRFSIDDFGTGYSSLAYLKRLPLYELKIDKSFVQDAPTDANDAAIVQAILLVAHHLRLRVVAEGVETQEQADFLAASDCEGLQGYLFGRPEPLAGWLVRLMR